MNRNFALSAALALASIAATAGAAPLAYVSSDGNDRTGCTLIKPCRTFQAAHDAVDARGEVVALDGADFGSVIVTKSVSIVGSPGFVASIAVVAKEGVLIETPGVDVVLRNLSIAGAGGRHGVDLRVGNSLTMENCVVAGLSGDGVRASATGDVRIVNTVMRGNGGHGAFFSGGATADIAGSRFMGNAGSGLYVESAVNQLVSATVSDSIASGNGLHGFAVRAISGRSRMALTRATASNNADSGFRNETNNINGGTTMLLGSSMSTNNAVGVHNNVTNLTAIPRLESLGNNIVSGNATDVVGAAIAIVPGF